MYFWESFNRIEVEKTEKELIPFIEEFNILEKIEKSYEDKNKYRHG